MRKPTGRPLIADPDVANTVLDWMAVPYQASFTPVQAIHYLANSPECPDDFPPKHWWYLVEHHRTLPVLPTTTFDDGSANWRRVALQWRAWLALPESQMIMRGEYIP